MLHFDYRAVTLSSGNFLFFTGTFEFPRSYILHHRDRILEHINIETEFKTYLRQTKMNPLELNYEEGVN